MNYTAQQQFVENKKEKAILVAIRSSYQVRSEVEEFLDELSFLADTAGAQVVARFVQERSRRDPAYFIGKGKAIELAKLTKQLQAELVIFDDDLSPAQTRNLETQTGVKVIDRTGLILDIFARRAKTREAKTQVELAQLRYLLPRLTRRWLHLSRQEGGIGTRGPGETQLEVDRRLIQKRIISLENELEKIKKQRDIRRKNRKDLFKVSLIGYTNTGKTTLLNTLTSANVLTQDRLFVTLDSTIRKLQLDTSEKALLIDTVGFIRKLPHHLIASFHSTLEEAISADLLLHVVDISHPRFLDQINAVNQVLKELEIDHKPVITVFNKTDLLEKSNIISRLREKYAPAVFVSATKGFFLQELMQIIKDQYYDQVVYAEWLVKKYSDEILAQVGSLGMITDTDCQNDELILKFRISRVNLSKLENRLQENIASPHDSNVMEMKFE